jgi:hypothetical protein
LKDGFLKFGDKKKFPHENIFTLRYDTSYFTKIYGEISAKFLNKIISVNERKFKFSRIFEKIDITRVL